MGFTWTIVALAVAMAIAWRFLGSYMAAVFEGRVRWLSAVERPVYRAIGVDPESEQSWQRYGASLIIFSAVALGLTYLIFRLQGVLPLNPQHLPAVSPVGLTYTFGKMVGSVRQGVAILAVMAVLFGGWLGIASASERQANPAVAAAGLTHQPTGNMEGKEVRFGDTFGLLLGRFAIMVPVLALAGSLAAKQTVAKSAGTFRTDQPMFVGLLTGVVLIVGALTFFPAVSLGPIVEQLSHGRFF